MIYGDHYDLDHLITNRVRERLHDAIGDALAERERFYTEREATYGVDAWPKG